MEGGDEKCFEVTEEGGKKKVNILVENMKKYGYSRNIFYPGIDWTAIILTMQSLILTQKCVSTVPKFQMIPFSSRWDRNKQRMATQEAAINKYLLNTRQHFTIFEWD